MQANACKCTAGQNGWKQEQGQSLTLNLRLLSGRKLSSSLRFDTEVIRVGSTSAQLPLPRNLGPLFWLSAAINNNQNTAVITPTHLHGLTIICEFDQMKRKRSESDDQSLHNSIGGNCHESPYARSPAAHEAFTKRTPPTPCCQHCAECCSRTTPTTPSSPLLDRRGLSLKRLKRSHELSSRSTTAQTDCLQPKRSPHSLPLTEENLHALVFTSLLEEASPMSTPRNLSPTRKGAARTHIKQLAGYNITFDHGTPLPATLEKLVKTMGTPREEAPSPHAQAIIDTRRAATMENESTGRSMIEGHLLFNGEAHAGGVACLTRKDQVNLVKDYLPSPPRPTVPELWGNLARPQPDSCIGYITATEAKTHSPSLTTPFSREEDDIAEWCGVLLLPLKCAG
jgi:hypothetical protein